MRLAACDAVRLAQKKGPRRLSRGNTWGAQAVNKLTEGVCVTLPPVCCHLGTHFIQRILATCIQCGLQGGKCPLRYLFIGL